MVAGAASLLATAAMSQVAVRASAAEVSPLALRLSGLGNLSIGRPVPRDINPSDRLVELRENVSGTGQAAWVPIDCGPVWPFNVVVGTQLDSGRIEAINILTEEIKTSRGIGLGSTITDVRNTYSTSMSEADKGWYTAFEGRGQAGIMDIFVANDHPDNHSRAVSEVFVLRLRARDSTYASGALFDQFAY